eukprot:scaffold1372_cov351-Pavlova_lutheri.AAC.6
MESNKAVNLERKAGCSQALSALFVFACTLGTPLTTKDVAVSGVYHQCRTQCKLRTYHFQRYGRGKHNPVLELLSCQNAG